MTDEHDSPIPLAIEAVVAGLGELEIVLGPQVRPALARVRAALVESMAARDRGDAAGAFDKIGSAMNELAALADGLDPAEAALMRAVAQGFRAALSRGDQAGAQRTADVMLERSGARVKKE